ncbi:hypothetical protein RclHR1_05430009 [Rhizophagus clarus]|uniref:Uncharacterized protein n=1 Tax=Rhizophagus clarus TaxID=94130 RepID=A0A2Z6SFK7_9GLOM|nr:hypothetical protein RclHR1_05430009 [Rhizophagus clarus]
MAYFIRSIGKRAKSYNQHFGGKSGTVMINQEPNTSIKPYESYNNMLDVNNKTQLKSNVLMDTDLSMEENKE